MNPSSIIYYIQVADTHNQRVQIFDLAESQINNIGMVYYANYENIIKMVDLIRNEPLYSSFYFFERLNVPATTLRYIQQYCENIESVNKQIILKLQL